MQHMKYYTKLLAYFKSLLISENGVCNLRLYVVWPVVLSLYLVNHNVV